MRMRTIDANQHLLLHNRSLSTAELEVRLGELGFCVPTPFCLSQLRSRFLSTLKFLQQVGAVDPDLRIPLPPELRPKKSRRFNRIWGMAA